MLTPDGAVYVWEGDSRLEHRPRGQATDERSGGCATWGSARRQEILMPPLASAAAVVGGKQCGDPIDDLTGDMGGKHLFLSRGEHSTRYCAGPTALARWRLQWWAALRALRQWHGDHLGRGQRGHDYFFADSIKINKRSANRAASKADVLAPVHGLQEPIPQAAVPAATADGGLRNLLGSRRSELGSVPWAEHSRPRDLVSSNPELWAPLSGQLSERPPS